VDILNDAVEDGELWQFLKLDRTKAIRYRELDNGKYEIIEEKVKATETNTGGGKYRRKFFANQNAIQ
jgi:hypothetical protein